MIWRENLMQDREGLPRRGFTARKTQDSIELMPFGRSVLKPFKPAREMSHQIGLFYDLVSRQTILERNQFFENLDQVVGMALGIGPPGNSEAHKIHRRGRFGSVRMHAKHDGPDLTSANSA